MCWLSTPSMRHPLPFHLQISFINWAIMGQSSTKWEKLKEIIWWAAINKINDGWWKSFCNCFLCFDVFGRSGQEVVKLRKPCDIRIPDALWHCSDIHQGWMSFQNNARSKWKHKNEYMIAAKKKRIQPKMERKYCPPELKWVKWNIQAASSHAHVSLEGHELKLKSQLRPNEETAKSESAPVECEHGAYGRAHNPYILGVLVRVRHSAGKKRTSKTSARTHTRKCNKNNASNIFV